MSEPPLSGSVAATVLEAVEITEIWPEPASITQSDVPSGVAAEPYGVEPTRTSVMTVLVVRLITDTTSPEFWLLTYAVVPSAVMDIRTGDAPTGIVSTTALLAVLITATEFVPARVA